MSTFLSVVEGGRLRIARSLQEIPHILGSRSRFGENACIHGHEGRINVLAIKYNVNRKKGELLWGLNIVTDAGDIYYAQRGTGATPTNAFGIHELGTTGDAPAKGSNRSNVTAKVSNSQKAHDGTYPKANDDDTDNSGRAADVATYRVSYLTTEANATGITRGIITNVAVGATEPVLCYWTITSFDKTSSDTLKLFVNHTMNGT